MTRQSKLPKLLKLSEAKLSHVDSYSRAQLTALFREANFGIPGRRGISDMKEYLADRELQNKTTDPPMNLPKCKNNTNPHHSCSEYCQMVIKYPSIKNTDEIKPNVAAARIQQEFNRILWKPVTNDGKAGFHVRKGWEEIEELNSGGMKRKFDDDNETRREKRKRDDSDTVA